MPDDRPATIIRVAPLDDIDDWEPDEDDPIRGRAPLRQTMERLLTLLLDAGRHGNGGTESQNPARSDEADVAAAWRAYVVQSDQADQGPGSDQGAALALAGHLERIAASAGSSASSPRAVDGTETGSLAASAALAVLNEVAGQAAQADNWSVAAATRGRYLACWHRFAGAIAGMTDVRESSVRRLELMKRIGEQVGTLHRRGLVHGTLLRESFDTSARMKNFVTMREVGPGTSPEVLEDLLTFRYQVTSLEFEAFKSGYRLGDGGGAETTLATFAHLDHDADRDDPLRGVTLPRSKWRHFTIRAVGYALRNFPEARVSAEDALTEAATLQDPERRAVQLATAILMASEGATTWREGAVEALLSIVHAAFQEGEAALVERLGAMVSDRLGFLLTGPQRIRLRLWCDLARAGPELADEAAAAMSQAGADLIDLDLAFVQEGVRLGYAALGKARMGAVRDGSLACLLRSLLAGAVRDGSDDYLRAAVELAAAVPPAIRPASEAAHLAGTASQLLSMGAEDRRALLSFVPKGADTFATIAALTETSLVGHVPGEAVGEPRVSPEAEAEIEAEPPVLPEARALIDAERWEAAASLLRRDLLSREERDMNDPACFGIAAMLCFVLSEASDVSPRLRPQTARLISDLTFRYSSGLLGRDGCRVLDNVRSARNASMIGLSAAKYASALPEDEVAALLSVSMRLLELAVELTPAATHDADFSVYANNLAIACQEAARSQPSDQAVVSLERSIALLDQVIEVDDGLAGSLSIKDRIVAGTKSFDLLNLGLACRQLAALTYSARWLHLKPIASAHYYRRALVAFTQSRALALREGRLANAATSSVNVGMILLDLVEYFVAERKWAGGDIHHAFYEWLRALAGGHVGTSKLLDSCIDGVLAAANDAGTRHSNGSLKLERLHLLIRALGTTERHSVIPADSRRDLLLAILEALEALPDQADRGYTKTEEIDLQELEILLRGLLRVELFRCGAGGIGQLQDAHGAFQRLYRTGRAVVRGLAGPHARWLDVVEETDGLLVNGLFAAGFAGQGLELRIPSQRRAFTLGGLAVGYMRVRLRDRPWVQRLEGLAAAHAQLRMNWDDVPPVVATLEVVGSTQGVNFVLTAVRLPSTGWDSWLVSITRSAPGEVGVMPSLPFIGSYDLASHSLNPGIPTHIRDAGRRLLFGQQGMTLEVALPFTKSGDASSQDCLSVNGVRDAAVLGMDAPTVTLLIQTAPRVTNADVAYFVSTEEAGDQAGKDSASIMSAALCCGATMSSTAPSFSVPPTVLHSFAPLFFFGSKFPPSAIALVNELDLHEIVVVGVPREADAADAALMALYDPRREIYLLVEGEELDLALASFERLKAGILESIVAANLLGVAGSSDGYMELFSNVQIIVVARTLAAAAAQMLLDLASVRRASVDGMPIVYEGRIARLSVKGNDYGARRLTTLLPNPARWSDLCALYQNRTTSPFRAVLADSKADPAVMAIAQGKIEPRAVFLFDPTDSSTPIFLPYMKQVGAIPVPLTEDGLALLDMLGPGQVVGPERLLRSFRRTDAGLLTMLPDDPVEFACWFQQYARERHAGLLATLDSKYPHLVPSRALLEEAVPGEYVILVLAEQGGPWSYLAANYAATLGSPVVQVTRAAEALPRDQVAVEAAGGLARHIDPRYVEALPMEPAPPGMLAALDALMPRYIGVVSNDPSLTLELVGEPPLATRFAIGRLSGPDLGTSSALIAGAALSEDRERPSHIDALIAVAANVSGLPSLSGAAEEAKVVQKLLFGAHDIRCELVQDAQRSDFLDRASEAQLIHFAGHGSYCDGDDRRSGLQMADGILSALDLPASLSGNPLVFGNACDSGLLTGAGAGRAWTGLAAAFVAAGAVGYIGSLRPVIDTTSGRLAEAFYRHLFAGYPVGEALSIARRAVYIPGDPTWGAYVLFGCPRVRIRTPAGLSSEHPSKEDRDAADI